MEKKRIVIADDHPIFRAGLRAAIEAEPSFSVIGEASDGEEAVRLIENEKPDVALLDYNMPGLNGFAVLAELAKRRIDVIPGGDHLFDRPEALRQATTRMVEWLAGKLG